MMSLRSHEKKVKKGKNFAEFLKTTIEMEKNVSNFFVKGTNEQPVLSNHSSVHNIIIRL
jgi:hypothetical protein